MSLSEQATFLRTGLLLGLIPAEVVIRWAEGVLQGDAAPPAAVYEVALAPPELTALRAALLPMAEEPEPVAVVEATLGLVARDLASGRRDVDDTVGVLAQMRRLVALPERLAWELDTLEDDHMLARAGVTGELEASRDRVRAWVSRYAGVEAIAGSDV